uniref:Reverse transcriptase domain-containing protein n=1 Tax=Gasterosteus aculeatus aculeatus TaxID=481459 RepID=A0AAQ4RZY3_GASAC
MNDLHLADELNEFYCRFERQCADPIPHSSTNLLQSPTPPSPSPSGAHASHLYHLPLPHQQRPSLFWRETLTGFKRQNPHKAAGPDSVSPHTLKHCADQLSPVFTDIFNTSLETCHVPACFKASTIIPVPKKPRITGLNDYRPVALTSGVMKSFERLVLTHLKSLTAPLLDPLQFAYRANRSVDDAVNMALHYILQHLDSPGTYARILFVDFSSAFNTIIPSLLQDKLSQLHVPDSTCKWITDFLSDRKQHVKLGKHVSASRSVSTGSPQGCVLSPLLFSLYTNSCTSSHQSVKLLKSAYRWESDHLVLWCSQNNLELNALKTVEMVVDFRRNRAPPSPITLCDSPVTIVDSFRFLGSIITQDLKWELKISSITKKAQQKLFFLRQLKKFNLPKTMMIHFYMAIIEPIFCSSITIWYAAATDKDKGRLQRVIRSAERVIGCNLPSLQDFFASRSLKRAKKIVADPSHPRQKLFVPLPSGRRLRSIRTKTSCHTNSFFPSAVGLINRARSPTD